MNRAIKFRAWDKKDNKFVNQITAKLFIQLFGDVVTIQDDSTLAEVNDRFILMQYTGLKDKNGVEIYDGDIIKHSQTSVLCKIIFKKSIAQYMAKELPNGKVWQISAKKNMEVIGNIYENPELIK